MTSTCKRPNDAEELESPLQKRRLLTEDPVEQPKRLTPASNPTSSGHDQPMQSTPRVFVFSSDPNAGMHSRKRYGPLRRLEVADRRKCGACGNCRKHKRAVRPNPAVKERRAIVRLWLIATPVMCSVRRNGRAVLARRDPLRQHCGHNLASKQTSRHPNSFNDVRCLFRIHLVYCLSDRYTNQGPIKCVRRMLVV